MFCSALSLFLSATSKFTHINFFYSTLVLYDLTSTLDWSVCVLSSGFHFSIHHYFSELWNSPSLLFPAWSNIIFLWIYCFCCCYTVVIYEVVSWWYLSATNMLSITLWHVVPKKKKPFINWVAFSSVLSSFCHSGTMADFCASRRRPNVYYLHHVG